MNIALKSRILASGKRQILLARETGISEALFSKIVCGWITPAEDVKERIAKALGVDQEEIFPTYRNGQAA